MEHKNELSVLLKKYLSGRLSSGEVSRLKELITRSHDPTLDERLHELWSNYTPAERRNTKAYREIRQNLHRLTYISRPRKAITYVLRGVAAVLLPLLVLLSVHLYLNNKSLVQLTDQEYTIRSDKGERATINLPDGTRIYLNSESSVSYSSSFGLDNRMVTLCGEAYFEIATDEKKPFVVQTSELHVKVLGTTFNLYAYPNDCWFEVTLIEGKVEAIPVKKPEKAVSLIAGQKARYNANDEEMSVLNTNCRIETAWKNGDLVFSSEPLGLILKKLASFYGVEINVSGDYPDDLFTGSYHEDDINLILRNLQKHYNFTYDKVGKRISIMFKEY